MKIFLVNDTDGEGNAYYAASTYRKALKWIKNKQSENIKTKIVQGWTLKELDGFINHHENPNELHPYDIQEMELDEEYDG